MPPRRAAPSSPVRESPHCTLGDARARSAEAGITREALAGCPAAAAGQRVRSVFPAATPFSPPRRACSCVCALHRTRGIAPAVPPEGQTRTVAAANCAQLQHRRLRRVRRAPSTTMATPPAAAGRVADSPPGSGLDKLQAAEQQIAVRARIGPWSSVQRMRRRLRRSVGGQLGSAALPALTAPPAAPAARVGAGRAQSAGPAGAEAGRAAVAGRAAGAAPRRAVRSVCGCPPPKRCARPSVCPRPAGGRR